MATLLETLTSVVPAERNIYTAKSKPRQYCTFMRVLEQAALSADDEEKSTQRIWRVTLFSKGDYEATLTALKTALKAAGYYVNSIDAEQLDEETGYTFIPLNIEELIESEV